MDVEKNRSSGRLYLKSLQLATVAMKLKDACSYGQPRQHIKKKRYHFANKGPYSESYDFFQ